MMSIDVDFCMIVGNFYRFLAFFRFAPFAWQLIRIFERSTILWCTFESTDDSTLFYCPHR